MENAADTKASVDASDYIPVIDMVNKGQMKKITVKALANAVARMITR